MSGVRRRVPGPDEVAAREGSITWCPMSGGHVIPGLAILISLGRMRFFCRGLAGLRLSVYARLKLKICENSSGGHNHAARPVWPVVADGLGTVGLLKAFDSSNPCERSFLWALLDSLPNGWLHSSSTATSRLFPASSPVAQTRNRSSIGAAPSR